jgi:ribosome-associated protein
VTDVKPSKSAKKREYQALQELGEQLIELGDDELAAIQTDDYLIEQVKQAKRISAHGALRRQRQLIGKIMREVDPEAIRAALAELGQADQQAKAIFKQTERWRDRIATDGHDALVAFCSETAKKSELLAGYVKDYETTPDTEHRKQILRKIFREIHRILTDR